jgi:beta-glucosidase-like glycosyl hydrolase/CubicO group peptidase (beta-lactamase class C family)
MHIMLKYLFCGLVTLPLIFKMGSVEEPFLAPEPLELEDLAAKERWIDSVMSTMTLEEKLGQCFMVEVYSKEGYWHRDKIAGLIEDYHIGGLIFMQGHPTRQANWANYLQSKATIPLLVAMDAEWGVSMRLDSSIVYPKQMTLGAISDYDLITAFGERAGYELRLVGANVSFAPVVDVNINPNNPVIDYRSFGEDKFNVALKGIACAQGLARSGVMACAKHFPGHGDTDKDSHKTLPVLNHTADRLHNIELYPFKAMINSKVPAIMAAHLNVPALDNTEGLPSSLSKKILTDLLRDSLGYEGLVFSDALNMKGVADYFKPGDLELKAFEAGNDILLFSQDVPTAITTIKAALNAGKLDPELLDEKVKRTLGAKYDLKLQDGVQVSVDSIWAELESIEAKKLRQQLYDAAMTFAANKKEMLPFKDLTGKRLASVSFGAGGDNVFQELINYYTRVDPYYLGTWPSKVELDSLTARLDSSGVNTLIVSFHNMSRSAGKKYNIAPQAVAFVDSMSKRMNVVSVLFGSPYSLKFFNGQDYVVCAYEENSYTLRSAAHALFGGIKVSGKLPVSASASFPAGCGTVSNEVLRLQYGDPEEVGVNGDILKGIDNIAWQVVSDQVAPGCQILVAKGNMVIYNKAFGYHTYDNVNPVKKTDLYDLASVTKVAASTISVMKLQDEGKIDVNKTVDSYMKDLSPYSTLKGVTIKKMMMHEAGLPGWIPFFKFTIDSNKYDMYYCDDTLGGFCVPVAEGLYLRTDYTDSMWNRIENVYLSPKPKYTYSDLGFYIIADLVHSITGKPIDTFAQESFFGPIGMQRTVYRPLEHYGLDEITPTENDKVFRQRLVHGYVHDPGAAMLGGVSGHAGLFSCATDLAHWAQMLLNSGEYGGMHFIDSTTIRKFTDRNSLISRRGIGWDKPAVNKNNSNPCADEASPATFGHTGFTGTAVWMDPRYDLTFIFLSNRVYPDATNWKIVNKNIRPRIQQIIYQAVDPAFLPSDSTDAEEGS